MKKNLVRTLLLSCVFLNPLASQADETPCREESLIHFVSNGQETPSQLIGGDDACDQFGGNLAYSPKHQRYIFVNFNIPGSIDLDQVDAAFAKIPSDSPQLPWISEVQMAVVTQEWLKRVQQTDKEAVLNMTGTILFVSEVVIKEGRFGALMEEFYGIAH